MAVCLSVTSAANQCIPTCIKACALAFSEVYIELYTSSVTKLGDAQNRVTILTVKQSKLTIASTNFFKVVLSQRRLHVLLSSGCSVTIFCVAAFRRSFLLRFLAPAFDIVIFDKAAASETR